VDEDEIRSNWCADDIPQSDLRQYNEGGFFVAYSAMSGGIFVDMAIHDVDISLWFFGEEQTVPKSVCLRMELLRCIQNCWRLATVVTP
jgi:predicted dehydrogenase